MKFDHEKLDVYKVSLEFVALCFESIEKLEGVHRHARDQLLRSSQSVPLNIAEGNGKRSSRDRNRFFEIARGSAMESAATLDVLLVSGAIAPDQAIPLKRLLHRVVSMLFRMTESSTKGVKEDLGDYLTDLSLDYEHAHGHEDT